MIWAGWRQTRAAAITLGLLLALLALYLVTTGIRLRTAFDTDHLSRCLLPAARQSPDCGTSLANFYRLLDASGRVLIGYLNLVPAFLGVFIGAPMLAREFENGTHRLAWTQTITRTRWVTTRLAVAAALAVSAEQALTWVVTFWRSPLDKLSGHFDPGAFSFEGIVPAGYALFAFAIGALAGAVIRRTIPAMATTLGVFIVVRLSLENYARPNFMTPKTISYLDQPPINQPSGSAGDWILDTLVPKPGLGLPTIIIYQPAARYWAFQLIEAGVCILTAAALLTFTIYWVRRRVR